ncbi:MAG: prephenate dehydrogenase [Burkholderiales bacterium]|jgi:prephenate dehydrogenase
MTRLGRAVVVGTGAVGGSVAGALRARGLVGEVWGVDPENGTAAREAGLVDRVAASLAEAVEGADLVVLAAPVPVNRALLGDPLLREALGARALLTDVSSTKASVVAAARAGLGARLGRFVASHPIAGSDRAGPGASRVDLLDGAHVIVCPTDDCDADALDAVRALWAALGARVASMTPEHHDRLFAEVSHWPHAVAFALSASVGQGPLADDARRYHGAGLRDTTRVGGSPPGLWAGILIDNRDASLAAAASFRAELDRIERALRDGDRAALEAALARGADWRSTL